MLFLKVNIQPPPLPPLPLIRHRNSINPEDKEEACQWSNVGERSAEYREMVNIFKPLIVKNLLVHDILPSLPFLGVFLFYVVNHI